MRKQKQQDQEEQHVLVCGFAGDDHGFTNNIHGTCECGTGIVYRPYNDKPEFRKLCMICAHKLAKQAREEGSEIEHCLPEEGKREFGERHSQADLEKVMNIAKELF